MLDRPSKADMRDLRSIFGQMLHLFLRGCHRFSSIFDPCFRSTVYQALLATYDMNHYPQKVHRVDAGTKELSLLAIKMQGTNRTRSGEEPDTICDRGSYY